MITQPRLATVRKYAFRELHSQHNSYKHAIYGIWYLSKDGISVQHIAQTPENIIYFSDNISYYEYVDMLNQKYLDALALEIYTVHRSIKLCVDGETGNTNVSPGYNIDCRA